MLEAKDKTEQAQALREMLTFVKREKLHFNSFNEVVDEALSGHPDWVEALTHGGVAQTLRTYCHD